jgi:protein transport protein SEC61 subunit gamma-like protein
VSKNYPKYDKFIQHEKPSLYNRLGTFIKNTKRIIKIANKPTRKEYFTIFKICVIGLALLGAVSYVIQLIFTVINSALGIS